jgi:hypothetical protein
MRILQLIVSGTLANAGRPERVKKKTELGHVCLLFFLIIFPPIIRRNLALPAAGLVPN